MLYQRLARACNDNQVIEVKDDLKPQAPAEQRDGASQFCESARGQREAKRHCLELVECASELEREETAEGRVDADMKICIRQVQRIYEDARVQGVGDHLEGGHFETLRYYEAIEHLHVKHGP